MENLQPNPHEDEMQPNWVNTELGKFAAGDIVEEQTENRLRRVYGRAKQTGRAALVAAEVMPITNEGFRYGSLAAAEIITRDPLVGAVVLGGTTLLVEGASAIATSNLIVTKTSNKILDWLNEKVGKVIPEDAKMSKPLEAGVALTFGTPALMFAKHREAPGRSKEEIRKQGLITAAWVAGVCAVEGAVISSGIDHYADPKIMGPAVLGLAAMFALPTWVKKILKSRSSKENNVNVDTQQKSQQAYGETEARYDLSPEELSKLEKELVSIANEHYPEAGMVGVWIKPQSKYANFMRTHEASYFPEVEEVSEEDEALTTFFALVDTRPGIEGVCHAAAVTGLKHNQKENKLVVKPESQNNKTGFCTVDELIERDNFTATDFYSYYRDKHVDPSRSIAIETNFRIGERREKFNGFGTAQIAYLSLMNILEKNKVEIGNSVVFATINKVSIDSFKRVGIHYEPLMGRTDMKTPESELGKESLPVAIYYDEYTAGLAKAMGLEIPELTL